MTTIGIYTRAGRKESDGERDRQSYWSETFLSSFLRAFLLSSL